MFRFLTIALLAGAALPVAAIAQDMPRPHADGGERGNRADAGPRPERAPRMERQQGASPPAAPPAARAQALPDRGSWRENRGGDANRSGWNGDRGGDGNRGWRGNRDDGQRNWRDRTQATPPAVAAPAQPAPPAFDRSQRRDWNRGDDGRRDWNRDDAQRQRANDNRRDWNRNDGRRDWNDRRYDNNRGWDGNRRWDGNRDRGRWDRGWRNDGRYNWQGYRASNRYAYRLPQYYAPRGWNYGYRRFGIGTTLFAGLFAQNYWISDPFSYRLPPVDWPFQWVRYYDDALLVDVTTGQVVDEIPGIFW